MAARVYNNTNGKYKAIVILDALLDGHILLTKSGAYMAIHPETHRIGFLRVNNDNMKELYVDEQGNYELIYAWLSDSLKDFIDWADSIPDDELVVMISQANVTDRRVR